MSTAIDPKAKPLHPINANSVLAALARHIGKQRAVHAADLVAEIMAAQAPTTDSPAHLLRLLRLTIVVLRRDGYHICGHPGHGYYLAADAADVNGTCEFLYSRAMTSLQQVAAMKRVSLPDLRGQLRLPE